VNIIIEKYQKLNKFIKCILWLSIVLFLESVMVPLAISTIYKLFEKQLLSIYDNVSPVLWFNICLFLSYACIIPVTVILIFLLSKFEKKLLCEYFPKSVNHNIKLLSLGFIIGMIEVIIPIICAIASGSVEITTLKFSVIPIIGFFFALIAAFFEEMCSRLCVYGFLREYTNSKIAVIFSIIFFLLPHIGNFKSFGISVIDVSSLVIGAIAYCIILEKSKSLPLVTGIHWGWNIPQLYIFNVGCSGIFTNAAFIDTNIIKSSFFFDESWGIEGTWMAPIMDTILCIAFLVYYQTKHTKAD